MVVDVSEGVSVGRAAAAGAAATTGCQVPTGAVKTAITMTSRARFMMSSLPEGPGVVLGRACGAIGLPK